MSSQSAKVQSRIAAIGVTAEAESGRLKEAEMRSIQRVGALILQEAKAGDRVSLKGRGWGPTFSVHQARMDGRTYKVLVEEGTVIATVPEIPGRLKLDQISNAVVGHPHYDSHRSSLLHDAVSLTGRILELRAQEADRRAPSLS